MKNGITKCRYCGRDIACITFGVYRKAIVDAEAVDIYPDAEGEDYVRIDGSKVRGFEAAVDCELKTEPAYRMHRKTCGRKTS